MPRLRLRCPASIVLATAGLWGQGPEPRRTVFDGERILGTAASEREAERLFRLGRDGAVRLGVWGDRAATALERAKARRAPKPSFGRPGWEDTETLALGSPAVAMAVADLNNDGHMDVALATASGVVVRMGDDTATFGPERLVWPGKAVSALAAADFDGDGHMDLVASAGGSIAMIKGDGSSPVVLSDRDAERFLVADWDGDAIPDLAFATATEAVVWAGRGDGRFDEMAWSALPGSASALAALDFDGDGQLDLAVALRKEPRVLLLARAREVAGEVRLRKPATALGVTGEGEHLLTRVGSEAVELWRHRQGAHYDDGLPASSIRLDDPTSWNGDLNGDGAADSAAVSGSYLKVTIGRALISGVSKTHVNPWNAGDTGKTFTIEVTGSHTVGEIAVVRDTLPAGMTFVSTSFGGWECGQDEFNPQIIECAWGGGPGPYPPIVITVDVSPTAPNVMTNLVEVFNNGSAGATTTDIVTLASTGGGGSPSPDVTISKTHVGEFWRGRTGATYTVTVRNVGTAATTSGVTVTEAPPAGMTVTGITGSGWNCVGLVCTNSQIMGVGGILPSLTVTVDVSPTAASSVTNVATVSGGGESNTANNTAADSTTVLASDLTISKTHTGNFAQGQRNVSYTLTVQNVGAAPTTGLVTVTENVPAGLTLVSMQGQDWSCSGNTCTRGDVLSPGMPYSPIQAIFDVGFNALSLVNTATVAGGAEANVANNTASDPTTISASSDLLISKFRQVGGSVRLGDTIDYVIRVGNAPGASASSGTITVTDTPGPGINVDRYFGTGWVCSRNPSGVITCTTTQVIAPSAFAESITVGGVVTSDVGPTLVNSATVAGGGDIVSSNNSATDTAVVVRPELTLQKTHTGNFIRGQAGATYQLRVINNSTVPTYGAISVVEQPPAGMTVTALSGSGWGCTLGNLTCSTNDASQPITVTVSVSATAPPLLTNSATVSGGGDNTPADNTASDATAIVGPVDLLLTKTASAGSFYRGQTDAMFTLAVLNQGGSPTVGPIQVVETPPAGMTITAMSGAGWTCEVPTLTCTRTAAIEANASFPITVTASISNTAPAELTNSATVSGGGDNTPGSNTGTVTVRVDVPDLTLTKTHAGNFFRGQTNAQYTLTVVNTTSAPSVGTHTVVEAPPAGLTVTAMSGSGWTCNVGALSCQYPNVPGSATLPPITVTVTVAADAALSLVNSATVSGGTETNTSNNTATDPTTVVIPDLRITKSHTGNFSAGSTGLYLLHVTNIGPAPTNGDITVVEVPPVGMTVTDMAGPNWTCNVPVRFCVRSTPLAPGASADDIQVTVAIADNAAASLTNRATVSGGGDVNTANNEAADVTIIVRPDLAIAKTHSGTFTLGQIGAAFSIVVTNVGTGPTSGPATVTEQPPAGLTVTALSGSGWTCILSSLSCTRSDALAPGAAWPAITVTANVAIDAGTSVTNTASVSVGLDTNASNNSVQDVAVVGVGIDLTLTKTHTQSGVGAGGTVTYLVVVRNTGGAGSTGTYTVVDLPPSGMTITSMSGLIPGSLVDLSGWSCSLSGRSCSRSGSLAAGAETPPIYVTGTVSSTVAPGAVLINSATVSGGGDSLPANNTVNDPITVGSPDLRVTLAPYGQMRPSGGVGGWEVTVTNIGTAPTTGGFTLSLEAPGLQTTGLSTVFPCSSLSQPFPIVCNMDPLAPGASWTRQFAVSIIESFGTTQPSFTLRATASGGGDTTLSNNTAENTRLVERADYQTTISPVGNAFQGLPAVFRVTVTNRGNFTAASGTMLLDLTGTGFTLLNGAAGGWTCTISATSRCERPATLFAPGTSASVDVTVNLGALVTSYTIDATVRNSNSSEESAAALANNTASLTVPVTPNVVVSAVPLPLGGGGGSTVLYPNRPGTVMVAVNNLGGLSSTGAVTVSLTKVVGGAVTALSGSGWVCVLATLSCTNVNTIAPGAALAFLSVTVTPAAPGDLRLQVTSTGGGGVNAIVPEAAYRVSGEPDLQINKTHTGYLTTGVVNSYTISVTNVGSGDTTQPITVVDTPPAGMQVSSMSGNGWSCTLATLTCTRSDTLGAGMSHKNITVNVIYTLPLLTPGLSSVTNRATVSMPLEPNTANNTSDDVSLIAVATAYVQLTIGTPRFDRVRARWLRTVSVTNSGAANETAVAIALQNITPGTATLLNQTGTTAAYLPAGMPYLELGPIAPGATVTRDLEFNSSATFRPHILGSSTPR